MYFVILFEDVVYSSVFFDKALEFYNEHKSRYSSDDFILAKEVTGFESKY